MRPIEGKNDLEFLGIDTTKIRDFRCFKEDIQKLKELYTKVICKKYSFSSLKTYLKEELSQIRYIDNETLEEISDKKLLEFIIDNI